MVKFGGRAKYEELSPIITELAKLLITDFNHKKSA